MSLWARKGVLVAVFLTILCLLMTLYATRRQWYCEQQVKYVSVADRHGSIERALTEPNITPPETPERPHTLPQHLVSPPTRTQVANVSEREWNVFDTQSSGKYTIIVQTYKRNDLLKRFLRHYNHQSFPSLDQIIVIWNNIGVPLERAMFQKAISKAGVPVTFIVSKINSMRNRLQPHPQIQTAAVMIVDDDLLIAASDVDFSFHTWQQFPQRIVGFVPRKHVFEPDGTIRYGNPDWKIGVRNTYTMVLIGASFVHKGYLKMFNETVPLKIHAMIDHTMNCDDLAINAMIGDYLARIGMPQPSGVFVAHKTLIQNMASHAKSGFRGVSQLPDHRNERVSCLKKLNDTYHGLSLPSSNLIVSKMSCANQLCQPQPYLLMTLMFVNLYV